MADLACSMIVVAELVNAAVVVGGGCEIEVIGRRVQWLAPVCWARL